MKIKWDTKAVDSLKAIYDFYKNAASIAVANKVKTKILKEIKGIVFFPEKLPQEPNLKELNGDFRFKLVWNCKVIFELKDQEILMLDIFHTSRNPKKIKSKD